MVAFHFNPGDVVIIDEERFDPVMPIENGIALRPQKGGNPRPYSWTEVTTSWLERRLRIERALGSGLPAKLAEDMRKDISVFTPEQQETTRYRMKFVRSLEFVLSLRQVRRKSQFRPAGTKPPCRISLRPESLDRLCERVARIVGNNGRKRPPSGAALLDWYDRYRKSGRCYCSLVPQDHHKGNWGTRHHPIAAETMQEYATFYYLQAERPPVSETFKVVRDEIRNRLRRAGVDKDLRAEGNLDPCAIEKLIPSDKSFYRLVQKLRERDRIAYRDDARTADRKLRIKGKGPQYGRIGAALQIDTTELPIVLRDPKNNLAFKQVQLTFGIDVASRGITGFYVGLERGWATIQETLRMTMLPKTWVAGMEGIDNSWDCTVKPVKVLTDQGADYRSESLVLACAQLGIRLMHTPAGHPELKGVVERLFRRAKSNMFAGIPGSLFKNGERRVEYDAAGNAILDMPQVLWIVTKFIADIYMVDWHNGIADTPANRWKVLHDQYHAPMVDEIDQLIPMISKRIPRSLQHTGIRWEGLDYGAGSDELQKLRFDVDVTGVQFDITIDAFDISRAYTLHPTTGRWIALRCSDPEVRGRTMHEHLVVQAERNLRQRQHQRAHRPALDAASRSVRAGAETVFRRRHTMRIASRHARRVTDQPDPMAKMKAEAMPLEHMPELSMGPNAGRGHSSKSFESRPRPPRPTEGIPSGSRPAPPPPGPVRAAIVASTGTPHTARRRAPPLPSAAIPTPAEHSSGIMEPTYVDFF